MRNTKAKTEIIKLIQDSSVALSHLEIQQELNGLCDRVTTYRVLDRLVVENIIHKIVNTDGVIKYAACHNCSETDHKHDHAHFSCVKCLEVTCLENVVAHFKMPRKFKVLEVNFTLSGVCPKCV